MEGQGHYASVEPQVWKPEETGQTLEGVLLHKEERTADAGARYYLSVNVNGKITNCMVWGTTVLDDRMQFVKIGDQVRITYKGEQPATDPKKNPLKIFKVEVWTVAKGSQAEA